MEILLKLPLRSLVQFKRVCKSWHSLISDPHFAKLHFEASNSSRERLLCLTSPTIPRLQSIDFNASFDNDSAFSHAKDPDFLPQNPYGLLIVGSCRGFILFSYDIRKLCLWNPCTGFHRIVFSPTVSTTKIPYFHGFGYDPSTDDYLVFQLPLTPLGEPYVTVVNIFSFRTNAWEKIEAFHLTYRRTIDSLNHKTGLFLIGAIHLVAFDYHASRNVIVVFDLTKRGFSEILFPPIVIERHGGNYYLLGVVGELLSLSYLGLKWSWVVEIWVMKEYRVQSSWIKIAAVSADPIVSRGLFPLCYTRSGDFVGIKDYTKLAKYDHEGCILEDRFISDTPHRCNLFLTNVVYTESLFSLSSSSSRTSLTKRMKSEQKE